MSTHPHDSEGGRAQAAVPTAAAGPEIDLAAARILLGLPVPLIVFDEAGRVHLVSDALAEVAGHHPVELQTLRDCVGWLCPDSVRAVLRHIADLTRTGRRGSVAAGIWNRSGSRIAVMLRSSALAGASGRRLFACAIEARHAAEPAATAPHQVDLPDRALLKALPTAIYTTDAAGRITFYNDAAAALWGQRPAFGSAWCGSWRLFWPDGRPMAHDECPMAVAMRENREVRGVEAIAERPDGTRVVFEPFPTPLRDASGAVIGGLNMLLDLSERKSNQATLHEREARLKLLARENDHRARNLLATVQAIARSMRARSVDAFVEALSGRLRALARVHSLLGDTRWIGADVGKLVSEELLAFGEGEDGPVRIAGPHLAISPDAAQVFAMSLHELATNAAKYGALSLPTGRVEVGWSVDAQGRFAFRWVERGGPTIRTPTRRGFGMRMIESAVKSQLEGELRLVWQRTGLICEMTLPAKCIAPPTVD